MKKLELGETARDTIAGYEGVIVCISNWLHGCTRITIQPREMDGQGRIKDNHTFDEPQVQRVNYRKEPSSAKTGGWAPSPLQNQITQKD